MGPGGFWKGVVLGLGCAVVAASPGVAQDWSGDNWYEYTFSDPGDYYLVGHVTVAGESWEVGDPQGGFNVSIIDSDRPEGWTDETHGNNASPNYDIVYAQDTVKRIDLIIDPKDWQAMYYEAWAETH